MERRTMLALLAASVAAAVSACTRPASPETVDGSAPVVAPTPAARTPGAAAPAFGGRLFGPPTGVVKVPVPRGTLSRLPGEGRRLALTVDDGTDPTVVAAYARLAEETGLRLTFFVNGVNRGWTASAPVLRPLVDAGTVFIANHTWSHPDLTKVSSTRVTEEVRRNETFLTNTFGVTGRPFLRPPYGYHNAALDGQLADLGYPAVTMWLGTLGDSSVQPPATIVAEAEEWLKPQGVVIGHANHPPVIQAMDQIVQLIRTRGLVPVHLGDVFEVEA